MAKLVRLSRWVGLSLLALVLRAPAALAQAYGQGVYNGSTYGGRTIHIGPVILPATGANIALLIASILAIVAGIIVIVWLVRRRRNRNSHTKLPKQTTHG